MLVVKTIAGASSVHLPAIEVLHTELAFVHRESTDKSSWQKVTKISKGIYTDIFVGSNFITFACFSERVSVPNVTFERPTCQISYLSSSWIFDASILPASLNSVSSTTPTFRFSSNPYLDL